MIALDPLCAQPAPTHLAARHVLALDDLAPRDVRAVLDLARALKRMPRGAQASLLPGKTLAMLFEKPSLRTRVSFEVGMTQLGGHALYAQATDFLIGTRETPEDAARTLSRYVDAVVVRTHADAPLQRFAASASVPVINGLSDGHHPCQALADLLTMEERLGELAGKTLAFIGDAANNVATSLVQAALGAGMHVRIACPQRCRPRPHVIESAFRLGKARKAFLRLFAHADRAVREADVIYTDTWVSMGESSALDEKRAALEPYRVTARLLAAAKPEAIVMHCLPAHRGEEIDAAVIDGPQSVVFDQAENRLHVQKALLVALLRGLGAAIGVAP